jgi:hypothetical protein
MNISSLDRSEVILSASQFSMCSRFSTFQRLWSQHTNTAKDTKCTDPETREQHAKDSMYMILKGELYVVILESANYRRRWIATIGRLSLGYSEEERGNIMSPIAKYSD